jgi:hypothetical protein
VDEITVKWPDGALEIFGPFEADRIVLLRRGTGKTISAKPIG